MLPQPLMLPQGQRAHCTGNCQHSHDEPAGSVVQGGVETRGRGGGAAKIDCKCWIIQPSPPPFEWVSSVTMRRAFIAKQEKIIFHRPPWRPWTPLINETKHLQPRHTDKDTLKQIYTHTCTEIVTHTHADMHAKILLTLISHSCTHTLADFESMQAHRAGTIIECETAKWS